MTAGLAIGQTLPVRDLRFQDRAQIARYVLAAGDDNPIHSDTAAAARAGFDDIVVPGMLIMGQIASALGDWAGPWRVSDLTARFVVPVVLGATVPLGGRVVAQRPDGALIVRITVGPPRRPHVLAEAVLTPPAAAG